MKFVCVSDSHNRTSGTLTPSFMPGGDVLLHAGDLTVSGTLSELQSAIQWLEALPYEHKVVIAGNHDFCFQDKVGAARRMMKEAGITYLEEESITLGGFKIYGSPFQPEFCGWAFNKKRGADLARTWAKIPDDTEILLTHGPALLIRDYIIWEGRGEHVGDEDLLQRIRELQNLRLHVFGHIHMGYGQEVVDGSVRVNAACCTESYHPNNEPIVVELP